MAPRFSRRRERGGGDKWETRQDRAGTREPWTPPRYAEREIVRQLAHYLYDNPRERSTVRGLLHFAAAVERLIALEPTLRTRAIDGGTMYGMPSRSWLEWDTSSRKALDDMENAHKAVGGTGPGRRYATQQLNQSYLVMLASHFQLFCRKLHSEVVDHLTRGIANPQLQLIAHAAMTSRRKLDQGNANPSNLGADFAVVGMAKFWDDIKALHGRNGARQAHLETMNEWRNAIAHQDFSTPSRAKKLQGRTEIRLRDVRTFRSACNSLAVSFDEAALSHIRAVVGASAGW